MNKLLSNRGMPVLYALIMLCAVFCFCASSEAATVVEDDSIVTEAVCGEDGEIQYQLEVPAGETVNYSVEPASPEQLVNGDKIVGKFRNTTNRTVTKTITVKVKFLNCEYEIDAYYKSDEHNMETTYKDTDVIISRDGEKAVDFSFNWKDDSFEKLKNSLDKYVGIINKKIQEF